MRVLVFGLLLFACVPVSLLHSETIHLKNGNTISCLEIQDEGDKIRCMVSATMATALLKSSIAQIEADKSLSQSPAPFRFDIWESGIDLDTALNIAERHDLPLRKNSSIYLNKGFHPAVREEAQTAREFVYWGRYLDEPCQIRLFFSPVSGLLYKISISWSIQPEKKEALQSDLEDILNQKYGRARRGFQMIGDARSWGSENTSIRLSTFSTAIRLEYLDQTIDRVRVKELERLRNQEKKANVQAGKGIF